MTNSSNFKYYIHDGVRDCRLQLLGQLGESDVAELSNCWETARAILGSRRLVLDVREVTSIDDSGNKWLAQMMQDGAACLPESFLKDAIAGRVQSRLQPPAALTKTSLWGRLVACCRLAIGLKQAQ